MIIVRAAARNFVRKLAAKTHAKSFFNSIPSTVFGRTSGRNSKPVNVNIMRSLDRLTIRRRTREERIFDV